MNQNKEPKDCLKCKRRGTDKCAFNGRDYKAKTRCLWVLSYESVTDSITHSLVQRTCAVCPNLSECSISQPGADVPPYSCPMMRMPINVISFDNKGLQIPEDPKYWAKTLKTYLTQHTQ